MTALPSTGLHHNVPFEVYKTWPAVNVSTLKPIRKTPMHCRWAMEHPKESEELNVGSALHVACFEPARFEREFYLGKEEYNASTREGKAARSREEAEAAGRTYIRRKPGEAVDCDSLVAMQASLWTYRPSKRFLQMPGQCEVSAVWQDPETGLMCKGRFDKYVERSPVGPIVIDLKSTRDGSEWQFNKDVQKLGYAIQAAYYVWGLSVITGQTPMHVFLGCENVGPYAAFWGQIDAASMQTGRAEFRRCLDLYAECEMTGEWPGYSEKGRELSLPHWANEEAS